MPTFGDLEFLPYLKAFLQEVLLVFFNSPP